MPPTTVGIKLDEETRERLQRLSALKDRSPHWIMKTAIREYMAYPLSFSDVERTGDQIGDQTRSARARLP